MRYGPAQCDHAACRCCHPISPSLAVKGFGGRLCVVDGLAASGYTGVCILQNRVCALKAFPFTTAVVVGVDLIGYERGYCYEHQADTQVALTAWDGRGHPSGPWIKCKGTGTDLFNPAYC